MNLFLSVSFCLCPSLPVSVSVSLLPGLPRPAHLSMSPDPLLDATSHSHLALPIPPHPSLPCCHAMPRYRRLTLPPREITLSPRPGPPPFDTKSIARALLALPFSFHRSSFAVVHSFADPVVVLKLKLVRSFFTMHLLPWLSLATASLSLVAAQLDIVVDSEIATEQVAAVLTEDVIRSSATLQARTSPAMKCVCDDALLLPCCRILG